MGSRPVRALRDLWPVVAALLLAVIAALPVLQARVAAEAANDTVELVADLEEFETFALREGLDPEGVWAALAEAGVTSLAVTEMTAERLERLGRASLFEGAELRAAARSAGVHTLVRAVVEAGAGDPSFSYLLTEDPTVYRRLLDRACARAGAECRGWFEQGLGIVEVPLHADVLEDAGLGIWPEDLDTVRRHGFYAVLRFQDHPFATPEQIRAAFDAAANAAPLSTVIFEGTAVLGAAAGPEALAATAAALREHGLVLGMIESVNLLAHLPQQGMGHLLEALHYRAARTYSIAEDFLAELLPGEAVDIWTRSPVERNIRVLYLRPILREDDPARFETTLGAVRQLVQELQRAGWRLGPASTFPPVWPTAWQLWGLAAGAAGLAVLLLRRFVPVRPAVQLGLLALQLAGTAAVQRVVGWDLTREALALLVALVAPTLAVDGVLARWGRRAPDPHRPLGRVVAAAVLDAVLAAATALAGALLLAALLGDVRYLLEIRFFRGVKLSLLLPPVMVLAAYFWRFGTAGPAGAEPGAAGAGDAAVRSRLLQRLAELRILAGETVRWRHVVLAAVGLVALVLYITRSGNLSRDVVPALELALRTLLEEQLGVRPRFKEFVLGYPALVLAGWMLARGLGGYAWVNAVAGAIGVASLVNTFQHLRTPVVVSLLRSFHGLWLGLLLGCLAVVAGEVLLRLLRRVPGWEAAPPWR